VTDMEYMLYSDVLFNQDISTFEINLVTTMAHMLEFTALSNANYSNALIAWNSGSFQNGVTLDCSSKYTAGAVAARTDFINNHGWTINDSGAA
jgi:hypothetical protein